MLYVFGKKILMPSVNNIFVYIFFVKFVPFKRCQTADKVIEVSIIFFLAYFFIHDLIYRRSC